MPPEEELPTLKHELPAPETYLPGTPTWYYWAAAAVAILLIILTIWAYRYFKNKRKPSTPPPLVDHFELAKKQLTQLTSQCSEKNLAEVAAQCSLTLRGYLAYTHAEPALYETIEESQARQLDLPEEVTLHLNDLNEAKYSASKIDEERAQELIKDTTATLTTLHQTFTQHETH